LRASGAMVAAQVADVTQPDGAAGLVQVAVAAFGGIDILINNVGGGGGGPRIADSTDEDWRAALGVNLIQTVRMMRLALPHMKGRAGASVVNVASISGWSAQLAMSGQYGAAKAALIFDTERWALEFVPMGCGSTPSRRDRSWLRAMVGIATGSPIKLISMITFAMDFRWGGWAPPRKSPTSSSSPHRHVPAGSTAGTFPSTGWNSPMRRSVVDRSNRRLDLGLRSRHQDSYPSPPCQSRGRVGSALRRRGYDLSLLSRNPARTRRTCRG
ncbi:MAG TPA: SDR family oxidoreductase, partial [Vicinamibacterales bacterium]